VRLGRVRERVDDGIAALRHRSGWVDHAAATVGHYLRVQGNAWAASMTYFGFLSFFPLLALAFFVVGQVSSVFPDARETVVTVLDFLLPGMVGSGEGQVPLSVFEDNAARAGLVGLLGLAYAGSGWMSGVRNGLTRMFALPPEERFGLVSGKARDLLTIVVVGLSLALSVSLSAVVSRLSDEVLSVVGLSGGASTTVLRVLGHVVAVAVTTVMFVLLYRLLAPAHRRGRSLVEGALLAALAFELLKEVAYLLIARTQGSPAFQAFGVSLVLVLWINYFSRILLLGAAWAHTAELRSGEEPAALPPGERPGADPGERPGERMDP
jgi:membrane protein